MLSTLLTLVLLAQDAPATCDPLIPLPGERLILQVDAEKQDEPHCFFVAPGIATSILLDAPVRDIHVEGEADFRFVFREKIALFLMPDEAQAGQGPLQVTLGYEDGAVPREVHLLLMVDDTLAERQVEVYRKALPLEALREKLRQMETRLAAVSHENAQLRAMQGPALDLIEALQQKWMDERGMVSMRLSIPPRRPGVLMEVNEWYVLRASGQVVVWLKGNMAPGIKLSKPLVVQQALLVHKSGANLSVLRIWQRDPVEAGAEDIQLMVTASIGKQLAKPPYLLKLKWEGRAGFFTVGEVPIPELPELPPAQ